MYKNLNNLNNLLEDYIRSTLDTDELYKNLLIQLAKNEGLEREVKHKIDEFGGRRKIDLDRIY
jgi:hypothetical protein